MNDKPMDIFQLSEWFQVSVPTVHRWVRDGCPCLRPSPGVVRFHLADVVEWSKRREDRSTGNA